LSHKDKSGFEARRPLQISHAGGGTNQRPGSTLIRVRFGVRADHPTRLATVTSADAALSIMASTNVGVS
jgi:hypothetical protein